MEYLLIFWASFLLGISGALMPGPVLTATVGEVTRRGFGAGPLIVVGHAIVESVLLWGLLAGAGPWLQRPGVLGWLGVLGGVALLGMGADMIRTAGHAATAWVEGQAAPDAAGAARGPVLSGIVTTVSNPYWYGWWATVGLSLAAQALVLGGAGIAVFFAGHLGADFGWYGLVAAAVAGGRKWIRPTGYRHILRACGALLVLMGGVFLVLGAGRL